MKAEVKEVAVVQPPPVVVLTMSREEAQALQSTFGNWGVRMVNEFAKEGASYLAGQAGIYYTIYQALADADIHPKYREDEE